MARGAYMGGAAVLALVGTGVAACASTALNPEAADVPSTGGGTSTDNFIRTAECASAAETLIAGLAKPGTGCVCTAAKASCLGFSANDGCALTWSEATTAHPYCSAASAQAASTPDSAYQRQCSSMYAVENDGIDTASLFFYSTTTGKLLGMIFTNLSWGACQSFDSSFVLPNTACVSPPANVCVNTSN